MLHIHMHTYGFTYRYTYINTHLCDELEPEGEVDVGRGREEPASK